MKCNCEIHQLNFQNIVPKIYKYVKPTRVRELNKFSYMMCYLYCISIIIMTLYVHCIIIANDSYLVLEYGH